MRKWLMMALLTGLAAACSTQRVEKSEVLSRQASWALLPIVNQSQTPQAGERVEALVETELRVLGLRPRHYPVTKEHNPLALLDEEGRFRNGLRWARKEGIQYGVTGSVQEWRYKSGLDGEPAAGISLRVIDVATGDILWAASGSRTGWGYESVSGTATKLVHKLLGAIRLSGDENPGK